MNTNIKTKTLIIFTLASLAQICAMAKGIYLVSGGDFRPCDFSYVIETTQDVQNVEITPYSAALLYRWQSDRTPWAKPWSVKCDGIEYVFEKWQTIRQGTPPDPGTVIDGRCTNAEPLVVTIPKAGKHVVKIYNLGSNLYGFQIRNPDVVSMRLNWANFPPAAENLVGAGVTVASCPKLKYLHLEYPIVGSKKTLRLSSIGSLPSLDTLEIANPEVITSIYNDTFKTVNCTNDMNFVNVTNVGGSAFAYSNRIKFIGLPNIVKIGDMVGFTSDVPSGDEYGLRVLRLGDTLQVLGDGDTPKPFYDHTKLQTIEFVTDEEDWVAAWNSHAIYPEWFGTATATSDPKEATLSPLSAPTRYYGTSTRFPKPTKLVLVRRSELQ